jgi:hypothetical protein
VEHLYRWSARWRDAQVEASAKKADQLAAVEEHLARMRKLEKLVREHHKAGFALPVDVSAVEFYRLEAEKYLLEVKKK